jgi:hypothetical protein
VIALSLLLYLWGFWAAYVLTMGIYRAHLAKRLTGVNLALALPLVALAYLMDIATNLLIAPLVFADLPREWLVTDRLVRYKAGGEGWRYKLASAICEGLLDPFDPTGDHC